MPPEEISATLIEEAQQLLQTNAANLRTLRNYFSPNLNNASDTPPDPTLDNPVADLQAQTDVLLFQTEALCQTLGESNMRQYPLTRVQLFQRQEEQRAKIAKELEETLGQPIANAIFELAAVKNLLNLGEETALVLEGINALQQELEQSLTDLRLITADLEPNTMLGNFGLLAGIRRYLEKFNDQAEKTDQQLVVTLQVHTILEPLPNIIEVALFRFVQEALQNIRRHAQATRALLTIAETDGQLKFSIQDDGQGFVPDRSGQPQRQLGFAAMQQIADLLNGKLTLMSSPGQGTQVSLIIPNPQF